MTYLEYCLKITDLDFDLNSLSNDELDDMYFFCFQRKQYHQTRESIIMRLTEKRNEFDSKKYKG